MNLGVNEDDIGIRTFQIRKQRAVERAIEKIRHSMKEKWSELTSPDIDVLEWALGETWAMTGFYEWDRIGFSFLDIDTAKKIIDLGNEVLSHKKLGNVALSEVNAILKGLREENI